MVPQAEFNPPMAKSVDDDDKPWCCRCGTDEYLNFESIEVVRHAVGMVDADYTCAKCESFYGHLVPTTKMGPEILTGFGIPLLFDTTADTSRVVT